MAEVTGWHHVCPLDVWRGVIAPRGQVVQIAGGAWGPPRCPVCHGVGHGGRSPSSGPAACPGADWGRPGPHNAEARRTEGDRRALVLALAAAALAIGALALAVLLIWAGASGS